MMKYMTTITKKLALLFTVGCFLSMSVQTPVYAGMVSSDELYSASQMDMKRDDLRSLIARDDVRDHLQQYGVSGSDLNERINSMTDAEILEFHAEMDKLPTGEGFLGAVIAIIVIFMLLDIAGATDIFPNI